MEKAVKEQCEDIAKADEYCRVETRCELIKGHPGLHYARLGEYSARCWDYKTYPLNFVEER